MDAIAPIAALDDRYEAVYTRLDGLYYEVEDAVAEQMLEGKLQSGDTARICLRDGKVAIEKEVPAPQEA